MAKVQDDKLAGEWHDLMARYHRTACVLDRELQAQHGLSVSEFEILQELYEAGNGCGSLKLHELGERVHLSQSALSRVVSGLEKDGLVTRATCTDDRRAMFLQISGDGGARYLAARPTQRAILREQAELHA